MTLKRQIIFFLFSSTMTCCYSQINYLVGDYSRFVLKQNTEEVLTNFPKSEMLNFKGHYTGGSFHLGFGAANSVGFGLGFTEITYQKQWLGTFPETDQFGVATLNGKARYLSTPLSLTLIKGLRNRFYAANRAPLRFGFTFSYCPSFLNSGNFSTLTYAGADSSTFISNYNPSPRRFQHTFTLGLCAQRFLFNRHLRFSIEPYLGYGSTYFSEKGSSATFTYGVKLQLGFLLPRISIAKQLNPGNEGEKQKLLEQKQKEITEQLNKQP